MSSMNSFLRHNSKELFQKAALGTQQSIQKEDFLSHIPPPLSAYIDNLTAAASPPPTSSSTTTTPQPIPKEFSFRVDEFEISTRSYILSLANTLLREAQNNDAAIVQETIEDLLSFIRNVIDVFLHMIHFANADGNDDSCKYKYSKIVQVKTFVEIPFLLLEDLAETLPIQTVQLFWNYGPSKWLNELLCKPQMFNAMTKLIVIRLCNKLLKHLSVSSSNTQAQFAGQILVMLASIFPLSERSGVNVLGKFNVDNVVEFESFEDWFRSRSSGKGNSNSNAAAKGVARSMGSTLEHKFYEQFWTLQKNFTDPSTLVPKDNADVSGWDGIMNVFITNVETVLGAFESNTFPSRLVKDLKNRWNTEKKRPIIDSISQDNSAMDIDDVAKETEGGSNNTTKNSSSNDKSSKRHYKYMTNSQLLHLQLQDPAIRMHILTQLFIISAYLRHSISISNNRNLNMMTKERILENLLKLEHRAGEVLKLTPPNGQIQYQTLNDLLREREMVWRVWKKNKCKPDISRYHTDNKTSTTDENNTKIKRRKLMMGGILGNKEKTLEERANFYSYKIDLKSELPSLSKSMADKHTPDIFKFLGEYVEALDPEAGIEEEYHPKNEKLFTWQAMRLLSREYIGMLAPDENKHKMIDLNNGDFEGLVRKIWKEEKGVEIPGEMPTADEMIEEEDEDGDGEDHDEKEEPNEEGQNTTEHKVEKSEDRGESKTADDKTEVDQKMKDENKANTADDKTEVDQEMKDVKVEVNETASANKDNKGQPVEGTDKPKDDKQKPKVEVGPVSDQASRKRKREDNEEENDKEEQKKMGSTTDADQKKESVKQASNQEVPKQQAIKKEESKPQELKKEVSKTEATKEGESKEDRTRIETTKKEEPVKEKLKIETSKQQDASKNTESKQANPIASSQAGKANYTRGSRNNEKGNDKSNVPPRKDQNEGRQIRSQKGNPNNATDGRQVKSNNPSNPPPRRGDERRDGRGRDFGPPQGRIANSARTPPPNDGHHMRRPIRQQHQQQPPPGGRPHPPMSRRGDRRFPHDDAPNSGQRHQGGRDDRRRGNHGGSGGQGRRQGGRR